MTGLTPPRRRVWYALVAAAVVASPGLATAGISLLPAATAPVELIEPADGAVLEAGSEATITWRARRDLEAEGIEEWEAFLSFDDGRQWPVRITPHLDIARSSFRFRVPLLASDRVRIMLRFGDERREVGFVLPHTLRSVAAESPPPVMALPVLAFERGEPARHGEPGVSSWVDGDRDGGGLTIRASAWTPPALRPVERDWHPGCDVALHPEPRTAGPHDPCPAAAVVAGAGSAHTPSGSVASDEPSLLLLHCRRNE